MHEGSRRAAACRTPVEMMYQPTGTLARVSEIPTLTPEQLQAWQHFQQMHEVLQSRLGQLLQTRSNLSNADYTVLVVLSEAPGRRCRVYELGRMIGWEKSRLHHQLSRMCGRGLVTREPDPDAPRAMHAVLTDAGFAAIAEAAPEHGRDVQRLFFDPLTDDQVAHVAAIAERVLEGLLAPECPTPPPEASDRG
jgi:DNA-binding MarR family transcriptional regulator